MQRFIIRRCKRQICAATISSPYDIESIQIEWSDLETTLDICAGGHTQAAKREYIDDPFETFLLLHHWNPLLTCCRLVASFF